MAIIEQSHLHQVLILNGHRFTGLSDDDPPIDVPDIDLLEYKYGMDGTMHTKSTNVKGGEVPVKLLSSSLSAKFLLTQFSLIQGGARILWSGSYGDADLGYSVQMLGGKLLRCPPSVVPGKTFEAVFVFEQLIPEYSAAQFVEGPIRLAA